MLQSSEKLPFLTNFVSLNLRHQHGFVTIITFNKRIDEDKSTIVILGFKQIGHNIVDISEIYSFLLKNAKFIKVYNP